MQFAISKTDNRETLLRLRRPETWVTMLYLLISAAIVGLILVPQWWAKRIFDLYRQPSEDFPGEGAELARHLLSLLELQAVTVQSTPLGDHYDPKG